MATGDHPDILSDDKKSMSESSTTFNACDTTAPSFDLNQMHSRFSDKKLYDLVLTQLLDVINLLIQIYPKEFVEKFVEDIELS